jgi:uncharacterized membrane protein
MRRRTVLATALLVTAAVSAVPAQAAKKKPKPITGSYGVTLAPDPTYEVASTAGMTSCSGVSPKGKDSRPFSVPAAGTLKVVLDSPDASKGAAPLDWDLYLVASDGTIIDEGTGQTAHEETVDTFKGKAAVSFVVCNNIGAPDATVSYTFTYK